MTVLICGDRNWKNFNTIDNFLATLPQDTIIIEGDCRGADKIAGYLAKKRGMNVITVSAKWDKFGKMAGPLRNSVMIHCYEPILVVAFHNDIEHSKGTKNMVNQAKLAGIEVKIIKEET
jgi:hypothetical protein